MYGGGKKLSKLRIQKQSEDNIIKNIRLFFFKLKKENKGMKDYIIRDNKTLFEQKEDYYKPVRVGNFWNNNYYIKYETTKNLPVKQCFNKIQPYLRDILINLQKFDTWKIQLTTAIKFISSKNAEEERAVHSKRDNIEFTTYHNANGVVDELFQSLLSRYHIGIETSM